MTTPSGPILQRSCALCGDVDDGPRESIGLPSGQVAYYHLEGDCRVENADPRPDLDEPPTVSRQRHALTMDPQCQTPDDSEYLTTRQVDAGKPDAGTVLLSPDPAQEA